MEFLKPKVKAIETNLFKIEFFGFLLLLIIGIVFQVIDKKCGGIVTAKLTFFETYNMEKILEVVERYAVIVGGASFFFQKWTEKDTQNIICVLILIVTMLVSRLFVVFTLDIIAFSITIFNILTILLFMFCLVNYCFIRSTEQNKKYAGK